jgi:hypothetical protein
MLPPSITWSQPLAADCWVPSKARWQRVKFPSRRRASQLIQSGRWRPKTTCLC